MDKHRDKKKEEMEKKPQEYGDILNSLKLLRDRKEKGKDEQITEDELNSTNT